MIMSKSVDGSRRVVEGGKSGCQTFRAARNTISTETMTKQEKVTRRCQIHILRKKAQKKHFNDIPRTVHNPQELRRLERNE